MINFNETSGLVPAIIQDAETRVVLMLGYMNEEAYVQTLKTGKVTFYSRSKQRIWVKGETSNHFLRLVSLSADCDKDCLLVKAIPEGPVCHTGNDTCWKEENSLAGDFLFKLETIIRKRKEEPGEGSYVASLFGKGLNKIAQKVGEEAVEMVIEAKDQNDELFLNESADLLFHYLVLLRAKGFGLQDVISVLQRRHLAAIQR